MASALQSFIMGEQAAGQKAQRDLALEQQRQQGARQEQAFGMQQEQVQQQQALRSLELMGRVRQGLSQIADPQERMNVMARVTPELERAGVQIPRDLTIEDFTDKGLAQLGGLLAEQRQQLTATERAFNSFAEGLSPEERQQAQRIQLGLAPRASSSAMERIARDEQLTDQVASSQQQIKTATERGKGAATTERAVITEGIDAAKGIPVLKRSLALLDDVKTSGVRAAALRAQQFFGVDGADEGELSANLGQAVLGDLRQTFGAAFTEKEGARLERIRANFGRSPAVNRRLLNQSLQIAEAAAERAIDRAIDAGDVASAEEIQGFLDMQLFDEAPGREPLVPVRAAPAAAPTPAPVAAPAMSDDEYNALRAQLLGG